MKFEDARNIWAAEKAGCKVEDLIRVDFDMESETEYNTFGTCGSYPYVEVAVRYRTDAGGHKTHQENYGRYDFEDLLKELFAVAEAPASHLGSVDKELT